MYCTKCGTLYADGQNFCRNCGADLRNPAPIGNAVEEYPPETSGPLPEDHETCAAPADSRDETAAAAPCLPEDSGRPISEEPVLPPAPEAKGRWWPPYLIMAILVLIGTLLFFLVTPTAAAEPSCFYVEDGTLFFEPMYYPGGEELEIPSRIEGQDVLHLAPACFADCSGITTIILPDTLRSIGTGAFSGCDSLRGIYIPESVKSIGDQAFMGCSDLEAIYLSDQVTYLGSDAFDGCVSLAHVFFSGSCDTWNDLYDEFISPDTTLYADDGELLLRDAQ